MKARILTLLLALPLTCLASERSLSGTYGCVNTESAEMHMGGVKIERTRTVSIDFSTPTVSLYSMESNTFSTLAEDLSLEGSSQIVSSLACTPLEGSPFTFNCKGGVDCSLSIEDREEERDSLNMHSSGIAECDLYITPGASQTLFAELKGTLLIDGCGKVDILSIFPIYPTP